MQIHVVSYNVDGLGKHVTSRMFGFLGDLLRLHAVHRCGLLLQMSHILLQMSVCVLGTWVSFAQMGQPIQMSFGG